MMQTESVPNAERHRTNPFLRPPATPPRADTRTEREEKERQASIQELAISTLRLDEELIEILLEATSTDKERFRALATANTLETLSAGEEFEKEALSRELEGRNSITRRYYKGEKGQLETAYVKPQLGEASYTYNLEKNRADKIVKTLHGGRVRVTREQVTNPAEIADIRQKTFNRPALREKLGTYYKIPSDRIPLHLTEVTPREGIEVSEATVREYIASRLNELMQLDVVPMTVLRKESDNSDICSVQHAVIGARELTLVDWEKISNLDHQKLVSEDEKQKNMRLKQSLTRLACFDYLVRMQDRHTANVLHDPETGQLIGIDNGYCMGLSSGASRTLHDKSEEALPIDPYVSAPLELLEKHSEWKIDEEALAHLQRMYDHTRAYLEYRENKDVWLKTHPDQIPPEGVEIKYITKLFRLLYQENKIAEREGLNFFLRLGYLVRNKRPPVMEHLLISQGEQYMNELRAYVQQTTPPQQQAA